MARPTKKKKIADNIANIEKWAAEGLTVKDMAKKLNVATSTLWKYKADSVEFTDALKRGRKALAESLATCDIAGAIQKGRDSAVNDLEGTMFKSAMGYERTVTKYVKVKRCIYENGKKADEWEEMQPYDEVVYYPPDTTAGIFLLKNWGNYVNEPRVYELKKKELEMKEKQSW